MIPTQLNSENEWQAQVFLVDDDDGAVKAVERQLRKFGLETPVVRAFDGVDALSVLRGKDESRRLKDPCVMLVDLNMPRLGGIALIRHMQAEQWGDPAHVFVLTTSQSQRDKDLVQELGIAGYLDKGAGADDSDGFQKVIESLQAIEKADLSSSSGATS